MRAVLYILAAAAVWIAANLIAQRLYPTYRSDNYGKRIAYRVVCVAMFFVVCGILALIGWAFIGRF
jgi:uncharacterized membrane protein